MNVITIAGNIGQSELKEIGGNALLEFSLAVKKNYSKDKNNDTQWFSCSLWGKRATALAQHLVKGAGIVVSGEMQLNYDKEKKKGFPKVNVDSVDIMKWANDSGSQSAPQQSQQQSSEQQDDFNGFQAIDGDDDIPF